MQKVNFVNFKKVKLSKKQRIKVELRKKNWGGEKNFDSRRLKRTRTCKKLWFVYVKFSYQSYLVISLLYR